MALIGTGAQALLQLASVAAVRDVQRVRVFSPTPQKRKAFIEKARALFSFDVIESSSVENAVEGADIVTLITRAKEPFLHASMLAPKAHLNAVGAILPAYAEFHQDVFDVSDLIVVDDRENARRGSGELQQRYLSNEAEWLGLRLLSELIDEPTDRAGSQRVSIFKGMGMGLSDLAIASMVYEKASARSLGRWWPHPERIDPISALARTERFV
ncbi:ornithine cyclodeaminase [Variovorax sp. PBS-H4]|nr:ornithine cyclodeaminase [Variovorax sp. PBS-H4]